MITHGIILLIIGTVELLLGIYFIMRRRTGESAQWYKFLIFSVAIWVLCNAGAALVQGIDQKYIFIELTYVGGGFIAAFFLLFSYTFPFLRKQLNSWFKFLILLPALLNVIVVIVSNQYFQSIEVKGALIIERGSEALLFIFLIYFLFYWIWGLINLFKSYKVSDGIHRWQLKYLIVGLIVSSFIAIIADMVFPLLGVDFSGRNWIGSEFSIIWFRLIRSRLTT